MFGWKTLTCYIAMFRMPRNFSKMEISLWSIDSNRWCFEGNEENEEKSQEGSSVVEIDDPWKKKES